VQKHTERLEAGDAKARAAEWKTWAQGSTERGGRQAHAFSRAKVEETDLIFDGGGDAGSLPVAGHSALLALLAEWLPFWCDEVRNVSPAEWDIEGAELPVLTVDDLDRVCRKYSEAAGLGWDRFHPRWVLLLPAELKVRLLQVLMAWEDQPILLERWLALIIFIAKKDGGVRPIGLTILWLKLLSRMRRPVCDAWEADNDDSFFWGSRGRACDRAGWVHNAYVGFAASDPDLEAVSFFGDLRKFYEHAGHAELWAEAKATKFNLKLLRWLTVSYAGFRSLQFHGCFTDPFVVRGTILAGCSCATTMARLLLVRLLRSVHAAHPGVQLRNVVDDVIAQQVATARLIQSQLGPAVTMLLDGFVELRLPTATAKMALLCANTLLALELTEQWGSRAPPRLSHTRNVDTDASDGRWIRVPIAAARRADSQSRAQRLLTLRQAGADVEGVHRGGPGAVALWGAPVVGITNQQLHGLRVAAARAAGPLPKGASVGLRLQAGKGGTADPLVDFVVRVVKLWALAIWYQDPAPGILDKLISTARVKFMAPDAGWRQTGTVPPHSWGQVLNPAEVLLMTLWRIGWDCLRADTLVDDYQKPLVMTSWPPALVSKLAGAGAVRWSDRDALGARGGGGWVDPIFWGVLRGLTSRAGKLWSPRQRYALRSVVGHTHWPMARLLRQGLSDSGLCTRCGAALGTLWHRCYGCDTTQLERANGASDFLQERAKAALSVGEGTGELFAAGIFPDPRDIFRAADVDPLQTIFWVHRPACGLLSGLIFTDGSARFPDVPGLRRAGWALVMVDDAGGLIAAAYGPVPMALCPEQTSRDAEDFAYFMASSLCMFPCKFMTDCAGTVAAANRIEASTGPGCERSHLWQPFWARVEPSDFESCKTLGHATLQHVDNGESTFWERAGNNLVDDYAKRGAAKHTGCDDDADLFWGLKAVALQAGRWCGDIHVHLEQTGWDTVGLPDADAREQLGKLELVDDGEAPTRDIWKAAGVAVMSAPTGPLQASGHLLVSMEVLGHPSEPLVVCTRCGAYSQSQFRGLRRECGGPEDPGLAAQRSRIRRLRHPACGSDRRLGRSSFLAGDRRAAVMVSLGLAEHSHRPGASPAPIEEAGPGTMERRVQLLARFGVGRGEVASFRRWARQARREAAQRRRRRDDGSDVEEHALDDVDGFQLVEVAEELPQPPDEAPVAHFDPAEPGWLAERAARINLPRGRVDLEGATILPWSRLG